MASKKAFGLKDSGLIKNQGFINGRWVDAKDGKTIKVTNPATGEELGTVPAMGHAETMQAIQAADKAFKTWSKTTAKYRHDLLQFFFRLMMENTDDLGRLVTLENGKTLAEGKGEVAFAASFLEWFAEEAVRVYGETIPSPLQNSHKANTWRRSNCYFTAALTPWNAPYATMTAGIGPALAAGCTTVVKPAPETPHSALALIPDGVINVVTTLEHVREVGTEICESKLVKKIAFTGSTAVAKLHYKQAAGTMKKVTLEAGGNAPFIVFDDADIDAALTSAIVIKFLLSGQVCVAANRIYVQSSIYNEFAARLAEKVAAFKVGDGLDEGTTHGPLIHSRAVDKVESHVKDAVKRGASVLVGGSRPDRPGSFFTPTVLSEVPSDALISTEETFGPLAALIRFQTEEEVLSLANDSTIGLGGYFFSRDVGRVWRVAEVLEAERVGANTPMIAGASTPFGGVKDSGLGREGAHGIEEYLNIKFISFGGI